MKSVILVVVIGLTCGLYAVWTLPARVDTPCACACKW
jgi:hypothetical protein